MEGQVCVNARILLDADQKFTRAKHVLVELFKCRAEAELHEIQIKPYKEDRSTKANRYYWGVVVDAISKSTGYTPAETHNELLGAVYGWKLVRGLDGREREIPQRRTTDPEKMNTAEFAQYIERCHQIAAELGVYIEPFNNAA